MEQVAGRNTITFPDNTYVSPKEQIPPTPTTLFTLTPDCTPVNDSQIAPQFAYPFFDPIKRGPADPILGINIAFNKDERPNKVNLGVGYCYDEGGKVPTFESVKLAQEKLAKSNLEPTYLPSEGSSAYNSSVQQLIFGADSKVVTEQRAVTVQALGGTGALKLGADFIKKHIKEAKEVWISDPSWENHRGIFTDAGFVVKTYPYYAPATRGVNFEGMLNSINNMPLGSVVLLHACCHNPTGADLTQDQWTQIIDVVKSRNLIPFLDMAYQGFGDGIEADGKVVRRFAEADVPLFVSNSFSKSLSLYKERVGALSIVTPDSEKAKDVLSNLKIVVRTNYSNPAAHGAEIVATILSDPELRKLWEYELNAMRLRISEMRELLAKKLKEKAPEHDFSFIAQQRGMFSYTGLSKDQMIKLRNEHAIYALESGRICIAALNANNIDSVVDAICAVL
jgi:aromatic-amino-acid transaminase